MAHTYRYPICVQALVIPFTALSLMGCQEDLPDTSQEGDATMLCVVELTQDGPALNCPDESEPLPLTGPQGTSGMDGQPGDKGLDGQRGLDGLDGLDGMTGQNVWVQRTRLKEGSKVCPDGGELIELFQGEIDETADVSYEVCDVVCNQGELYEPDVQALGLNAYTSLYSPFSRA